MPSRTQAALLIDAHHPLPEPLILDGTPEEADTRPSGCTCQAPAR